MSATLPYELCVVNTGSEGKLTNSELFSSSLPQLQAMVQNIIATFKGAPDQPNRLLFSCHGGAVNAETAKLIIDLQSPHLLQNGIYPVYFVWHSGIGEILTDMLKRKFNLPTAAKAKPSLVPYQTLANLAYEGIAKRTPAPWREIKQRAASVFADGGGGWQFVQLLESALQAEGLAAEIHLLAHSAGSLVLATLLQQLLGQKSALTITTCSLHAPASLLEQLDQVYAPAVDQGVLRRFFLYTLTDELELKDRIPIWKLPEYGHSILYLLSRGFEGQQGAKPLLGLSVHSRDSAALKHIIAGIRGAWIQTGQQIRYSAEKEELVLACNAQTHVNFDEPTTMNAVLKTILNSNTIPFPF